ncbi:MAG: DMT family transporter [Bryobacterales bacterium]|nr:DMT family transporter [Bryobacterales bacterium]
MRNTGGPMDHEAALALNAPATPPRAAVFRATLALVAVSAIWGSTFTLVKGALDDASSLLFLTLRFGLATLTLWIFFRSKGPIPFRAPLVRNGAIVGLALFGGYLFQTVGLRFTTPARSAFLTGMFIVFVPALLALRRRKLPKPPQLAGIAVALAGLRLLASPVSFDGASLGDILTLICAVSYAVHILLLSRFSNAGDVRALTLLQIAMAFLLSAGSFWWAEEPVLHSSTRLWVAVGVTGILATAVAFLVQTWAQQIISPTRTAFIFALEPVFAWVTSFLVIGERLSANGMFGAALILAGIFLVETTSLFTPARRPRLRGRE